jgi:hypothetical protein
MELKASICKVYKPSEDVVARDVQGEFIIIPITSGIGDVEDEIFALNETGRAIWERLDGKKTLGDVGEELAVKYEASKKELEEDILGLTGELLKRRMLVEVS